MSASDNDIEKQKRRHRGPLIGIAVVVIFALGYMVWWFGHEVSEGTAPQGSDVQIDGRTGEVDGDPQRGSAGGGDPASADNAPAPPATAPAN
ncbi:hypothetical protein [Cereibacter johrii]|uniref:Uncharacterized protein n=1 Tax=Cereibacter johrii TaxID=445629 RepID=A0ABX5J9T1_9RHOB|nr:hypothetical protein [Cereibacter johrii]ODM41187.1 hypothetical protein A9O63_10125 [Cereibacter johrii]PTM79940.1 hypothetical protein C8J29_1028 [Cereibacter johrii]